MLVFYCKAIQLFVNRLQKLLHSPRHSAWLFTVFVVLILKPFRMFFSERFFTPSVNVWHHHTGVWIWTIPCYPLQSVPLLMGLPETQVSTYGFLDEFLAVLPKKLRPVLKLPWRETTVKRLPKSQVRRV